MITTVGKIYPLWPMGYFTYHHAEHFRNPTFCSHGVFLWFLRNSEQTAFIFLLKVKSLHSSQPVCHDQIWWIRGSNLDSLHCCRAPYL